MSEQMTWVSLSVIAREYKRNPETIRRWAVNGLLVECGFTVRRDITGHWIVGVPHTILSTFSTRPTDSVVNQTQSI